MRTSLSTRLALSYLVVILIGMGLMAPLAWLAVERLYVNTQSVNLLAQAQLIAAAMGGSPVNSPAPAGSAPAVGASLPYSQLSNSRPGVHTRVIDAQGAVVIDFSASTALPSSTGLVLPELIQNPAGQVTPEELLSRPEIAQALSGRPATAVRRVSLSTKQGAALPVLYAAAPVLSASGGVTQIVYLASPLPDTGWAALPAGVRWQFAGAILAAFLLASGAGLLFARRISRPLDRLAAAADAVAGGDLDQAVPVDKGIADLEVLSRAFNTMTASLRQSDQAKNAFIADVTHELRTPLTVIKGTIETLQDGAIDDLAARGPFLDSMNRETERLIRLVNDLLVLARADAGALHLQLCPLDLVALARSRCEAMRLPARARSVALAVDDSNDGCLVLADADRIAQVIDNLLANAIRYSPEGGQVNVVIQKEGEELACRVIDTGSGIPAQHLPLIFERFYRADPARGRSNGGSGLGLSIVRGLVAAHGGRVAAESVAGRGATITFWLPVLLLSLAPKRGEAR